MNESKLVTLAQEGDVQAFENLIEDCKLMVVNTAFSLLKNYDDALDASQDVFLKAFRCIGSYKGESSFSTWIYRITKNHCIDMIRKQGKCRTISIDETDEDERPVFEIAADRQTEPDANAVRNARIAAVRDAIDKLPPISRELIVMREINQMSYNEIGEALGLPEGTVKSRLSKAHERLKKLLKKNIELFFD